MANNPNVWSGKSENCHKFREREYLKFIYEIVIGLIIQYNYMTTMGLINTKNR